MTWPVLYLKAQGHLSWHLSHGGEILTFLEIPRKRTNYRKCLPLPYWITNDFYFSHFSEFSGFSVRSMSWFYKKSLPVDKKNGEKAQLFTVTCLVSRGWGHSKRFPPCLGFSHSYWSWFSLYTFCHHFRAQHQGEPRIATHWRCPSSTPSCSDHTGDPLNCCLVVARA